MKRIMAAMLCCLLLAACGQPASPTTQPSAQTIPIPTVTTAPPETTQPADPSLSDLRGRMAQTQALFAVAAFGWQEGTAVSALAPELTFLTGIPDVRTIGKEGELFCIVPADQEAEVTVSLGKWYEAEEEYRFDDVIYQGSGEPIWLFCNSAGAEPDTQIRISGPSGETIWYPMLDDNHCPSPLENEAGEQVFYDFTPYRRMRMAEYETMVSSGWEMPAEADLVGTTWIWDDWRKDGRNVYYQVTFQPATLRIRWNDGFSSMDQVFADVPWTLSREEGAAVLTIDLGESYGVVRYDLLRNAAHPSLYFGMDALQEDMPIGLEPQYRYLTPAQEPDTGALQGLWELVWTEVEGERLEAQPGTNSLELYVGDNGLYCCSLMDRERPENDFYQQEVLIFPFEMYENCENQSWVAAVNYTSALGVSYDMALIYGDLLEVVASWEVDGVTRTAYSYYRRFID